MKTIRFLTGSYGIYKFPSLSEALDCVATASISPEAFLAVSASATETSVICPEGVLRAPTVAQQEGWTGMYFAGQLDFELVGVLSALTGLLAKAGMGVLAISTYDTDYVFVPNDKLDVARRVLLDGDYTVHW